MKKQGLLSDYIRHRWLLVAFVARDVKNRYTGTLLGMLWSLAHPIVMLALYTVVFSVLFQANLAPKAADGTKSIADDALFICCAILPWIAFQEALQRAVGSLADNANLIKKVAFPSAIIPVHIVISSMINQLPGIFLLVAAFLVLKGSIASTLLLVPLVWLLQLFFTAGLAWLLSSINVFFRDVMHIMMISLLIWMFLTPIFYSPDMVDNNPQLSPTIKFLYGLNPMKLVVDIYRDAIFMGQWSPLWKIALLAGYALASMVIGHTVFIRNKGQFADLL